MEFLHTIVTYKFIQSILIIEFISTFITLLLRIVKGLLFIEETKVK
jgi:hypothetical protein